MVSSRTWYKLRSIVHIRRNDVIIYTYRLCMIICKYNCNGRKVYSPMVSFEIKVDSTVESENLDK